MSTQNSVYSYLPKFYLISTSSKMIGSLAGLTHLIHNCAAVCWLAVILFSLFIDVLMSLGQLL